MVTEGTQEENTQEESARPEAEKAASEPINEKQAHSVGKENPLAKNFSINFDLPISSLSSEFAKAYEVKHKGIFNKPEQEEVELYALVFDKGFPVRTNIIKMLEERLFEDNGVLPKVHDSGLVQIPKIDSENFGIILEKPRGKSLRQVFKDTPPGEKILTQNIMMPLHGALGILSDANLIHGSINIDNIYYDSGKEKLYLGECFSGPCGYNQPIVYESILRATCHEYAKGVCDPLADYFALGAVVIFLVTGKLPMEGKKDKEILETRLFKNSFISYSSNIKLSGPMGELLRGLLADKTDRRWSKVQLDNWLRHKTNQTSSTPAKEAMRGFIFGDKEFFNCRSLVYAMDHDHDRMRNNLKVADLDRWIKHSLLNTEMAARFEDLPFNNKLSETVQLDDFEISRVMIVLDPYGPIRFNGYSMSIHGIGPLLAYAVKNDKREIITAVGNVFALGLVNFWADTSDVPKEEEDPRYQFLPWDPKKVTKLVRNFGMGFGIERALYETNPTLPCLSPMLNKFYITDLKELLEALDKIAAENMNKDPIDRHIAAFIASRIDMRDDVNIRTIAEFEISKSPQVVMLALMVAAQTQSRAKNLKHLTEWVAGRLTTTLKKLHGNTIKKEMEKTLKRLAKEGDLSLLFKQISNPDYLKKDNFSFKEASRYYRELTDRINLLSHQENTEKLAYHYGLRVAVLIGYFVCTTALLYFMGKMF